MREKERNYEDKTQLLYRRPIHVRGRIGGAVGTTAFAPQQKTIEFRAVFHMTLNIAPDGSGGWAYDTEELALALLD